MSENTDIPGLDGLVTALTGDGPPGPAVAASIAENFGGGRPPFPGSSSSGGIFSTIENFIGGGRPPSPTSTGAGGGGIFNSIENFIFGSRRRSGPSRPLRRPPPRPVRRRPQPFRRPPIGRRQDDGGFKPSQQLHPRRTKRQIDGDGG